MRHLFSFSLALFASLAVLSGCDSVDNFEHEPEYVVEAYLIANEPLRQVRLMQTIGVNGTFNATTQGVRNATVNIELLAANGTVETTYAYQPVAEEAGVYLPVQATAVLPLRTYRLRITTPTGGEVTATTLVPGDFEVVSVNKTRTFYQDPDQFEANITRSEYPGRQAVFVFSVEAMTPTLAEMTPFYLDDLDGDAPDLEAEIAKLAVNESPLVNEGNYEINTDGTITVKLPWLAVVFYGTNQVRINALDANFFDFIRSQGVQQGGSNLAPGEIPNVIEHIEGGTGVFGSFAQLDLPEVMIDRPPGF